MKINTDNSHTDIKELHSIAAKLGPSFKKMSIANITDLLWYFPFRYDDLSQVKDVTGLIEDEISTVRVKIQSIKAYRSWKRKMMITEILVSDTTDTMQAVWFRQKFVSKILKAGDEIFLSGKAQKKNLSWQFINPTYEKVKDNPIHSARLVPIYHLKGRITQKQLRFLMDRALKTAVHIDDPLPADLLNKEKYPWLHEALQEIHFPTDAKKLKRATQRLKFQELFYLQCKYQLAKLDYQAQASYQIELNDQTVNQTLRSLPFILTKDQQTALYDILADLSQKKPMNRLLEGDVGSGKTIVALLAGLNTVAADLQVAMMAPTEILAGQHFVNSIKLIPKKYLAQTAMLTRTRFELGDHSPTTRAQLNKKIKNGDIKFVIGTHALIQEKIAFKNLGLVVIDEQHRFGVKQRQSIKEKNTGGRVPHLLSMTATPIPRTLSLTLYGDLDISLIKEKPAGRQPIKTFLIPEKKRQDAYKFVLDKIKKNQQVFVVCPLIDESDTLGVKSVTQEYDKLNKDIFPDLEIRLLHGKLKTEDKEKIMADFKNNKFPILVATSVIEVGVDIPQATVMFIESAERFGLSQLHQFRGRIGRNNLESFCLLFTTDDSQLSRERLQALTKSNDGFELSELDLKLRGSGEIFGTKQTGLIKLKIAQLSDTVLIKKAQTWAKKILGNRKYLSQTQLQELLEELKTDMRLE
jgi:ATP-dependent DNA helicase RecG